MACDHPSNKVIDLIAKSEKPADRDIPDATNGVLPKLLMRYEKFERLRQTLLSCAAEQDSGS